MKDFWESFLDITESVFIVSGAILAIASIFCGKENDIMLA
jgi:hypothetical protein